MGCIAGSGVCRQSNHNSRSMRRILKPSGEGWLGIDPRHHDRTRLHHLGGTSIAASRRYGPAGSRSPRCGRGWNQRAQPLLARRGDARAAHLFPPEVEGLSVLFPLNFEPAEQSRQCSVLSRIRPKFVQHHRQAGRGAYPKNNIRSLWDDLRRHRAISMRSQNGRHKRRVDMSRMETWSPRAAVTLKRRARDIVW
jgi:hypothetical protein